MDFKTFLNESDDVKQIRAELKHTLKISNRDVSVRVPHASSITVDIKSMKALVLYNEIETIGLKQEEYERDEVTGEILSGGNTFVQVGIDYKFVDKLKQIIQDEFETKLKDGKTPFKLFNKFNVNKNDSGYWLSVKGSTRMYDIASTEYVGTSLIHFIINVVKDTSLFKYIK